MDKIAHGKLAQTIHLVYLRLDAVPEPAPEWLAALPAGYRERLAAMRSPAARHQTVAGLRLLEAAGARLGLPVALARLGTTAEGKPVLAGGPAFSLSHSGDYCVCALAEDGLLGADIERHRALALRRLQRFLAPAEREAAATDVNAFFPYWTAREATIKATGRVGPRRLQAVELDGACAHVDGATLHLQYPHLAAGYTVCVASDAPAAPIAPQPVSLAEDGA